MTQVAWQQRAIAFAGLLQAVHLVSSIARTGTADEDALDQSIRSIFVQNPRSITDVFCGTEGISTGLDLLVNVLGHVDGERHGDLYRYTLAVIKLERRLARQPALLRDLGARIARIDERRMLREADDAEDREDIVIALAGLYQDTLSRISPRIKVSGKRNYLQSASNTARIRALLLAAVRAAVLWHQVGGRRWQLVLARRQLLNGVKYLK